MTSKICYKCKEAPANFKNKQDEVCRECLEKILIHKFKNALKTHVRFQKDFPNLVAISGGSNSMAMLHFLFTCMEGDKSAKRMFLKCHILYIDEGAAVYGWTEEQAEKHRAMIAATCEQYKMKYTIIGLESLFDIDTSLSLK